MQSECWLWAGAVNRHGYPQRKWDGKTHMIHRVVYENEVGEIPEGLTLDHLCRVTTCINPSHMEAVTLRQNILRGQSPSALNAVRTHCANGHKFNKENTGWERRKTSRTARYCKTCRHRHMAAWYARKKAVA